MLLGGAAAIALAAAAPGRSPRPRPGRRAARPPFPTNILLQDWTGPYDGVPPWDKVKPELFPQAFQFGIDELRREIDAIADEPGTPTLRQHHRGAGQGRPAARPGQVGVRGDDRQYVDARISGARQGMVAASCRPPIDEINLNGALFAAHRRRSTRRASTPGLDAKQQRLVTRTYDSFVRRGAKLNADAEGSSCRRYNQQLAAAFSRLQREAAGRRGDLHQRDRGRAGGRSRRREGRGRGGGQGAQAFRPAPTPSPTPARRSIRC